jgi:hypothetical protein
VSRHAPLVALISSSTAFLRTFFSLLFRWLRRFFASSTTPSPPVRLDRSGRHCQSRHPTHLNPRFLRYVTSYDVSRGPRRNPGASSYTRIEASLQQYPMTWRAIYAGAYPSACSCNAAVISYELLAVRTTSASACASITTSSDDSEYGGCNAYVHRAIILAESNGW